MKGKIHNYAIHWIKTFEVVIAVKKNQASIGVKHRQYGAHLIDSLVKALRYDTLARCFVVTSPSFPTTLFTSWYILSWM